MENYEYLSHPLFNTIVAVFFGAILVNWLGYKWQRKMVRFNLIRSLVNDLNIVYSDIMAIRRICRLDVSLKRENLLRDFTNIESGLRKLQDEAKFLFSGNKDGNIIIYGLNTIRLYFREISNEIEHKNSSNHDNIPIAEIISQQDYPFLSSLIDPITPTFKADVIDQFNNVKKIAYNNY